MERAIQLLAAIIFLVIGSLIVGFHNVWSGIPLVLTVFGWARMLLRSTALPGGIDPTSVGTRVAQPLFAFQRLPPTRIDFIVSA